jgi:hypothetical protein
MSSPGVSVSTATSTADLGAAQAAAREPRHIWPRVIVAFGLALTVAWICLLGYGLVKLVELAI